MKSFFSSCLLLAAIIMFTAADTDTGKTYGEKFKPKGAISVNDLPAVMGDKETIPVILQGTIYEVCQAEGCWMRLQNTEDADPVFVKFKDHSFVIPKDLAGHKTYVNGIAKKQTLSVDEQRHYAEDAGMPQEKINKITEPKTEISVEATGVIIQ